MIPVKIQKFATLGLLTLTSVHNVMDTAAFTSNIHPVSSQPESNALRLPSSSPSSSKSSALFMVDMNIFGGPVQPLNPISGKIEEEIVFTVGCTVQTTKEIKAYQVSKKGFGSYNESEQDKDKSFAPLDWEKEGGVSRADKCLVMPKGLRGVVKRVYADDDADASHPIVTKFMADDDLGGAYRSPITFAMHLRKNEVEIVES